MRRRFGLLLGCVATLPLAVEKPVAPGPDTDRRGQTTLRAAGGIASYGFMVRGCNGNIIDQVPVQARDAAVGIDHRFGNIPLRVGVRGGWTSDEFGSPEDSLRFPGVPQDRTLTNRYVNPYVTLDNGDFAISAGPVFHEREFITAGEGARQWDDHPSNDMSLGLRIGREDAKYFQASWMESMPLYSDGGYLKMGIGGRTPNGRVGALIGLGAGGPMEGAGPMLETDFALTRALRVQVMMHANTSTGAAVGVGASYAIPH